MEPASQLSFCYFYYYVKDIARKTFGKLEGGKRGVCKLCAGLIYDFYPLSFSHSLLFLFLYVFLCAPALPPFLWWLPLVMHGSIRTQAGVKREAGQPGGGGGGGSGRTGNGWRIAQARQVRPRYLFFFQSSAAVRMKL